MDYVYLLTSVLFIISIIRRLLLFAELISSSNYKLNLIVNNLKKERHTALLRLFFYVKSLIIVLYLAVILYENILFIYHILILLVFIIDFIIFVKSYRKFTVKIRQLVIRDYIIGFAVLFLFILLVLNPVIDRFLSLLILERLSLLIYLFVAFLFSFPYELAEDIEFKNLRKNRQNYKNLYNIIISGQNSNKAADLLIKLLVNKSSVINRISIRSISELSKVLNKIDKNKTVLNVIDLQSNEEDLMAMCDILKPQICIINNFQNRLKQSFLVNFLDELFQTLVDKGVLIFNIDQLKPYTKINRVIKKFVKTNKKIYFLSSTHFNYATGLNENIKQVSCSKLSYEGETKYFSMMLKNKNYYIHSKILDNDYLNIVAPAVFILKELNYSYKEIARSISKLEYY